MLEQIKTYADENRDKKIAMFVDMDGVIADLDINDDIANNKANVFLEKRPLKSVINILSKVSEIENIDLYILSACGYRNQAVDKSEWLSIHAPFFKKENQIYVVREVVNYTHETKTKIKTDNILDTLRDRDYDLAIYLEDEFLMLKMMQKKLGDKIMCIHISSFIK